MCLGKAHYTIYISSLGNISDKCTYLVETIAQTKISPHNLQVSLGAIERDVFVSV